MNQTTSSGGVTFLVLLTIVFITLRLCQVIDWSWWWVLSPIWILIAIILLILAGGMLIAIACAR